MTVRDIEHHLARTLGVELSHDTISKITDAVLEEVRAWQSRPLDPVYPVVFIDALVVKVRDGAHVTNKAAHIVVGIDTDGVKHVLGIWVQSAEGAKFWLSVLTELRNRGVRDTAVRLLRRPRGAARGDRDGLAARGHPDLRGAPDPGLHALRLLPRSQGRGGPAEADLHRAERGRRARRARRFHRLEPGPALPRRGRGLGTRLGTVHPVPGVPARGPADHLHHQLESLNYQLRKIIKNRGHFPSDDAVVKLLWLAIRDIEDKRARARAKQRGKKAHERSAPGRLVEGAVVQGWKQALNALAIAYPGRLPDTGGLR